MRIGRQIPAIRGTNRPRRLSPGPFEFHVRQGLSGGFGQRLIKIGDQIVRVFDAD